MKVPQQQGPVTTSKAQAHSAPSQSRSLGKEDTSTSEFQDLRPEAIAQRQLSDEIAATPPNDNDPLVQRKNDTGLPDNLKSGIENLSGHSMDDVKVHYNSSKPTQLNAHAYAQGTDIHVASGQEKHLPHEAWHVVQQKQGRVQPTLQMQGVAVNDDVGLEKEADVMGEKAMMTIGDSDTSSLQMKKRSSQMVFQLRTSNPHKWGDGVTSHHIIPDEILNEAIGDNEDPHVDHGDNKAGIKAKFLPDFGNITLDNLLEVGGAAIQIDLGDQNGYQDVSSDDLFDSKFNDYLYTFSEMEQAEKDSIKIKIGGEDYNMADFERDYTAYRADPDNANDIDLGNMASSYYEWQGGNLFYGPSRVETMPSNGFDNDASSFYDQDHVDALRGIYDRLSDEVEGDADAATIQTILEELADLTRNMEPSFYNGDLYTSIKNQTHLNILNNVVDQRRVARMQVGKSVPKSEARGVSKLVNNTLLNDWKLFAKNRFKNHKAPGYDNTPVNFVYQGITASVNVVGDNLRFTIEGGVYNMPIGEKNMNNKEKGVKGVFNALFTDWLK